MDFPIYMNHHQRERLLRALRPYPLLRRMIEIYRFRKTVFIFLFCTFLCLNHIYPVIHIVPPFSSNSTTKPLSNPDFIYTQTLKEHILKLSINSTADSLKKSNTHILDLFNHQDLNRDQNNALKICQYMDQRSVTQVEEANREINKAIDDLDSFLDYEIACGRFRQIDECLTMAANDQRSCLQQFRHVGMIDHHEGRSEGQSLLISFVFDLKIPTFLNLSHSLEMAKEIEKDCNEKIEKEKKDEMTEASLSDFGEEEEEEEEDEEEHDQEQKEAIDSEL